MYKNFLLALIVFSATVTNVFAQDRLAIEQVKQGLYAITGPGGNIGVTFNAVDYQDTRIDIKQKSIGGNMNWRVRANTRLEFGAEFVDISQRGERNRPHNLFARGSMNF